ncbi:unnamed protein product, partial [Polarella glacialis]
VIHAACPALHDLDQRINDLTEAYAAIFVEFCRALGSSEPSNNKVWTNSTSSAADTPKVLRLIPLSEGLLENKRLNAQMGRVFWTSVAVALERLPLALQRQLEDATIEVCISRASELPAFSETLRVVPRGHQLGSDCGRVTPKNGNYEWVRKNNSPSDRMERLAASSMTMQAVYCEGYYLSNGRAVELKHVAAMVANTTVLRACEVNAELGGAGHETSLRFSPGTVMEVAEALASKGQMAAAVNAASAYL